MNSGFEILASTEVVISPPASELLKNIDLASQAWPELMAHDSEMLAQTTEHVEQIDSITQILDMYTDPTRRIEDMYNDKKVTTQQLADFYSALTGVLANKDTERLLLYLPFELLPDATWVVDDRTLQESIANFQTQYVSTWVNLLSTHDVRANFVDGDVLEVELREADLPRVVKAAQLAPMLVSLGLLSLDQLNTISDKTDDPILRRDLRISTQYIRRSLAPNTNEGTHAPLLSVDSIKAEIDSVFDDFVAEESATPNRLKWLREVWSERKVTEIATQLLGVVKQGESPIGLIDELLDCAETEIAAAVLVQTAILALETSDDTSDNSKNIYQNMAAPLLQILKGSEIAPTARVQKLLYHCYHNGVVSDTELAEQGLHIPHIAGDYSANARHMTREVQVVTDIIDDIKNDKVLSQALLPVVTVGGSRIKGYGQPGSDLDLTVFITQCQYDEDEIRAHISELFVHKWGEDQPIEVWITGNETLEVIPPTDDDPHRADQYWTHLLFNSVWIGDDDSIQTLHRKLLPTYFADPSDDMAQKIERQFYLERIEQDALQYRLMHKGYDRYCPRAVGKYVPQNGELDGDSTFWDPGFRMIATRLFVEKVFLPRLSKI